jgi:beta-lactamase regulating signal transducer with metallopeptidase domain
MNRLPLFGTGLPVVCQEMLQAGIRLLIQSSLLLLLGLAAGYALRRSGPERQRHLYQTALVAVVVCGLFSLSQGGRLSLLSLPMLPSAQALDLPATNRPKTALPAAATSSAPATSSSLDPDSPAADNSSNAPDSQLEVRTLPDTAPASGVSQRPANAFRKFLNPEDGPQTSVMGRVYIVLAGLWCGVTALLLVWLTLCYAGIRGICRRAQPVLDEEVQKLLASLCAAQGVRAPALLASREIDSVFLASGRRPAILLPAHYATEFDWVTLRAILAHEVAHLRACDGGWTLLSRLCCAVLWMQPLLWRICRLREQASEEACDLAVVAQGCSPGAYADCLVTLAERLHPSRWEQVAGSGSVVFRSSLAQRVQRLLSGSRRDAAPLTPRFRAGIALGGAACALLLSLAVSAAPLQVRDSLDTDTRLDKRVAVTAEGVPIGDLLALMSRKTGVDLSASADLIDNKLVILGPPRPLRDVVNDLAALYNAVWLTITRHDGLPHYKLVRDVRTTAYEERLAQDALQPILAKLDEQIRALNETPEQLAKRAADDPIRETLSDPDGRMATSVLASLSAAQREQLVVQGWIRVPVGPLDPSLKDDLEVLFHGKRLDDLNDMAMKQFHGAFIPNPSISRTQMEDELVSFTMHNMRGMGSQATDINISMDVPTGLNANAGHIHADAQFLLPTHGNPYTGRKIASNALLPAPADVQAIRAGAWIDRLLALAEKTGTPLVSDYYRSPAVFVPAHAEEATSRPPLQALDAFCRPAGYLWWDRGKTLLFRKRDWYTQQLYEVPDRWMLAISQHLKEEMKTGEKGFLTVGDALSVLQLSTQQIAGLDTMFGWPSDRLEMAGLREMLATIAAMHPDEKTPLYTGVVGRDTSPARIAFMPNLTDGAQQAALMSFIQARARTRITPQSITPGDFGFILLPAGNVNKQTVAGIDTMIYSGKGTMTIGYRICLPLTLPNDRHDATQVEVKQ